MRHLALALLIALAASAASVAAAPGDPFAGDDSGCIPPTPTDAKCEDGVAKAITKYAQAVEKCHIKAADAGAKGGSVADDLCESDPSGGKGAKEKFDAAIAKLAGTCSGQCAFVGASSLRATVEGLIETGNGLIYACAGTAFGDDDTGNIPADPATGKCEDGVAKAISKYIGALITCHIKAADAGLKGKPFDDELCESNATTGKGAREKYDGAIAKLDAKGCPACSVSAAAALRAVTETNLECHNGDVYCAGTTPAACAANCPTTTTTVVTSTTTSTTTSTATTTTTSSTTTTTIPPCGTFLTTWGSAGSGNGQFNSSQANAPFIVGVDASGNVYVSDSNNQRVQAFDNAGTFLTKWGTSGGGDGQFGAPFGIGFDTGGDVFVADAGNNRVQVFTTAGAFVRKWGSTGTGSGQFNPPVGLGIDAGGNVFVAEFNNNRVQKFDNAGNFLLAFGWGVQDGMAAAETCSSTCGAGVAGSGDGQFTNPLALAVDGNGNVFVTESGPNCRVQKFTNTGTFVTKWSFPCPTGIAVDVNGNVFVGDDTSNVVRKYTNGGTFVASWPGGAGGFNVPWGVAVDTSGNVFVGDRGNNRIQKFACP